MQSYDKFEGTIGTTYTESTPWYPERPHPGSDAPNVVVILLDDTGFAHFGCYGSDIDTPNIDRLAAMGVDAAKPEPPAAFAAFIADDVERWKKVVKDAGVTVD